MVCIHDAFYHNGCVAEVLVAEFCFIVDGVCWRDLTVQ